MPPIYLTERWRTLRADVLKRDGGWCQYCGRTAQTADHVIPRTAGGADSMDNLVASCHECNRIAGRWEFRSFARKKEWIESILHSRGIWFEGDRYY
jgi:5-methylcytosine-specific restriction endonuclease McrA